MTLVSLNRKFIWPGYSDGAESTYNTGQSAAMTLDAAGDYFAVVLQAAEDMSIRTVDVLFHTATGTTECDIRIENLDASGLPDNTLWATNTNGLTGTLGPSAHLASVTLGATATITKGQKFAVVVRFSSGATAQPAWIISGRGPSLWRGSTFPYMVTNTGSGGTKAAFAAGSVCMALGDATPSFYEVPGLIPWQATVATWTYASNATIRAVALRFQVPFKCRVIGMRFDDASAATTDDVNCVIYNSGGSEVGSTSTAINRDETFIGSGIVTCFFGNHTELAANTTYYAAVVPSTTNSSIMSYMIISNTNRAGAVLGGAQCYGATRDSGGSWTTYTTNIPRIDIIIDQIDDGSGSGGGGGGASFSGWVG